MLIAVMSFGDKKNTPPPAGLAPVAVFFLVFGIGCALGVETGNFVPFQSAYTSSSS